MYGRKNTDPGISKDVQVFAQMTQMKFKPQLTTYTDTVSKRNQQKIKADQKTTGHHNLSQLQRNLLIHAGKRLKYLVLISGSHFLVGNENQIDLIGISGVTYGFIDTQYLWSLTINKPIQGLAVDTRKCYLALTSDKSVSLFYYSKKLQDRPVFIKEIQIQTEIKFVQFPTQSHLGLFYDQEFQIYVIQQTKNVSKKCKKSYKTQKDMKLFAIPQAIDNTLNVFFQAPSQKKETFILYTLKITLQLIEIKVHPLVKVYEIINSLKRSLNIQNYSKQIFFLNIGHELIAARKGFIIDSVQMNILQRQTRLKYIPSQQRLLHIGTSKVQIYNLKIDTQILPNRLIVSSIDSIQINSPPPHGHYFGVLPLQNNNFAIFYQNKIQTNNYARGQIAYWFALTQGISIENKIKKLFKYGPQISYLPDEILDQKCDIARKIGLSDRQIYLQIWNRTAKSSVQDYQFLLATRHYKTIHSEMQKKLKKQAMSFRQLIKIYLSCIQILKQKVASDKADEQSMQQYLTCHLLIRKLKLFKEIHSYELEHYKPSRIVQSPVQNGQSQHKLFMIDIQQFYQYKNFDIKTFFLDKISDFCVYKKQNVKEIRIILRAFKFIFRTIYYKILEQVIIIAKAALLSLLQAIPQLLPHYNYIQDDEEQENLYQGIWRKINDAQWNSNLHLEAVQTIDNAQVLAKTINSVWFRRYQLTSHDLVPHTKQQILQYLKRNSPEEIFYYFIAKAFEKISDKKNLEIIVQFLQNFYQKLPDHIKGKIFLYYDLFVYYCSHRKQSKSKKLLFQDFLKFHGQNLFRYFFDLQKVRKNCILKQIKPIYQQSSKGNIKGIQIFNEGLLQYFDSQLSEVSDLKYLLNRMNNQKLQFHQGNISTYEVLVHAMQLKLKIGSDRDTPIQQVLIYIESIPLSQDNYVMDQLHIVQRINQQSERFRQMKINMTIRKIIENCQDVIAKIVEYQFQKHHIRELRNYQDISKLTYKILAQVQTIKEKIYGDQLNNLPLFIYISKLLQDSQQIQFGDMLLKNQILNRYFVINETTIQNLVLYMYKWKFSQSSSFINHQQYIKKLVTLLPAKNKGREFIQNQLQFALLLSSRLQPIQFPISLTSVYPRVSQLIQITKYIDQNFILTIDIDQVYEAMRKMQQIELKNKKGNQQQDDNDFFQIQISNDLISKHQVYEVFITRMLDLGLLKQVIPYIRTIFRLDYKNKSYNAIYLILTVMKLAPQLNDQGKHSFFSLIAYCFYDLEVIFEVLEFYMNSKLTSLQKSKYLMIKLQQKAKVNYNFRNNSNPIFKQAFKNVFEGNSQMKNSAKQLIEKTWLHLRQARTQFHKPQFQFMYIILCHEPYLLAKFIYLNHSWLNLKLVRSFISHLTQQEIFDEINVLQLSKRIFYMILYSFKEESELNAILFQYQGVQLTQNIFTKDYHNQDLKQEQTKFFKSIQAFQKKKNLLLNSGRSRRTSNQIQSQTQTIKQKLLHPQQVSQKSRSEYIFQDSDDQLQQQKQHTKYQTRRRKKKARIQFDIKSQRNKFLLRQTKGLSKYLKEHQPLQNLKIEPEYIDIDQPPTPMIKSRQSIQNFFKKQQVDQSAKIKKAMTLIYNPLLPNKQKNDQNIPKNNFLLSSFQLQKKNTLTLQSTAKKRITRKESDVRIQMKMKQENQSISQQKQQSNYVMFESQSQIEQQKGEAIANQLLNSYNESTKLFNLQILKDYKDKDNFIQEMKEILKIIYYDKANQQAIKLQLISAVCKSYPKIGAKPGFIHLYIHIYNLLQRYNISVPIHQIFTYQNLYLEGNLDVLFKISAQKIIEVANDQNIHKLSKVISLGFRKNVYQAQITYLYLVKMINTLQKDETLAQFQTNMHLDLISQLLSKLSIRLLRQKVEKNLQDFQQGVFKRKLGELIVQSMKLRGDLKSSKDVQKKLNNL